MASFGSQWQPYSVVYGNESDMSYGQQPPAIYENQPLIGNPPAQVWQTKEVSPQPHHVDAQIVGSSTTIRRPIVQQAFPILSTTLATIAFIITGWFAQATFSSQSLSNLTQAFRYLPMSNTLGVLRTLQEFTSVLTGFALNSAFEAIEWAAVGNMDGLNALSFLSLSPSTSLVGVLGIVFGRRARLKHRFWGIMRLTLVGIAWASGFVLFCKFQPI